MFLRTDAGVPCRAAVDDQRHAGEGLHVVDCGWITPDARLSGEGRLDARVSALALDALHQAGLFTADIGPCAFMDHDVRREACAHNVLADIFFGVKLLELTLHRSEEHTSELQS